MTATPAAPAPFSRDIFDAESGKPLSGDLSPEEFFRLASEGRLQSPSPKVELWDPQANKSYVFDVRDRTFLRDIEGLRPLTEQEKKKEEARAFAQTGPGQAAALAKGVASGLTLTASDLALKEAGLASPETLEALEEEGALAGGIGEFAGAVGGALLSGGGSLAARGGIRGAAAKAVSKSPAAFAERASEAVGRKVLAQTGSKVKAAAARGAADAAIYSTAAASTQALAERDPEVFAQSLVGGIGASSLLGGILGGSAAKGAQLFTKGRQKLAAKIGEAAEELGEAGEKKSFRDLQLKPRHAESARAFGLRGSDIQRLASRKEKEKAASIFGEASDEVFKLKTADGEDLFVPGLSPEENSRRVVERVTEIGEELSDIYREISERNPLTDITPRSIMEEVSKDAAKNLSEFYSKPRGKALRAIFDRALPEAWEEGLDTPLSGQQLVDLRSAIRKYEDPFNKMVEQTDRRAAAREIDKRLTSELEGVFEDLASAAGDKDLVKRFRENKKTFAKLADFQRLLARRYNFRELQDRIGLIDATLAGSYGSYLNLAANLAQAPGIGAAGALGLSALGKEASEWLLSSYRGIAPGVRAQRAYEEAGLIEAGREVRSVFGKIYSTALDISKGIGKKTKGVSGKLPRFPRERTISVLSSLALSERGSRESEGRKVAMAADNLRAFAANPESSSRASSEVERLLGPGLAGTSAEVTTSSTLGAAAGELLKVAPPSPKSALVFGLTPEVKRKWEASPLDSARFIRVAQALEDPLKELERAGAGDVNVRSLNAVKAVYPALYTATMREVLGQVQKRKNPLSTQERSLLAILLEGTELEMPSESLRLIQQSLAEEVLTDSGQHLTPEGVTSAAARKPAKLTQKAIDLVGEQSKSENTFSDIVGVETD